MAGRFPCAMALSDSVSFTRARCTSAISTGLGRHSGLGRVTSTYTISSPNSCLAFRSRITSSFENRGVNSGPIPIRSGIRLANSSWQAISRAALKGSMRSPSSSMPERLSRNQRAVRRSIAAKLLWRVSIRSSRLRICLSVSPRSRL